MPDGGFIFIPAWYHFFITKQFLDSSYLTRIDGYQVFTSKLADILNMSAGIFEEGDSRTARSAMFSFYYLGDYNHIFIFQLQNQLLDELLRRTEKIFETIAELSQLSEEEVNDRVKMAFVFKDKIFYLDYRVGSWSLIDPLFEVAQKINESYRQVADRRVNKPDIILHEENLNKKFTFGDNWVLKFDGLSTLMNRPNDVAIYSGICDRNVLEAERFYNSTILPRHNNHSGHLPIPEQQEEYFNYFELITTALIFAFTAVEAFVNSIIPDHYQYTTTGGTVHDKTRIERNYPLTKKLIKVLTVILAATDPESEAWWDRLSKLQDLRDQTILSVEHLR